MYGVVPAGPVAGGTVSQLAPVVVCPVAAHGDLGEVPCLQLPRRAAMGRDGAEAGQVVGYARPASTCVDAYLAAGDLHGGPRLRRAVRSGASVDLLALGESGELTVTDIAEQVAMVGRTTVSSHLRVLRTSGVVEAP